MKCKRFASTLLATILMLSVVMNINFVFAAVQTSITPDLTLTPNNEQNYISLNWNMADTSQKYSYMIYSKKSTDTQFQSIPAKSRVKVLNIYPSVGNNLKTWMETNGYGKGLITVDAVDISAFNANPNGYLKDSNGNWKYDVVYEGAWDCNNYKDLSASSAKAIEAFINAGRGYLAGHDTFLYYSVNRNTLCKYLNIIPNVSNAYGSTSVRINKKGLLTNYPWAIGDINTILTVPLSHTSGQYAFGDVWIKYNGNMWNGSPETTSYNGKPATNNFYLTTWNNTAMIQTGHSNGSATADEQKILANTLFYLAQVTEETSWDDHKGQDLDAPDKPVITSVVNDMYGSRISINFSHSADRGTTYDYYVEATGLTNGVKTSSEIKTATITTGTKGYSIVVDTNPGTVPPGTITTTSTNYVINQAYTKDFYVHIAAIDNVGNISQVTHYKYTYVSNSAPVAEAGPDQTVEATSPEGALVTLDAGASSDKDGDTLKFKWSGVFGTVEGEKVAVLMPIGTNTVTLEVSDSFTPPVKDTVKITVADATPPAITSWTNPAPNSNGWYNSDVTVSFTAKDTGTGVKSVTAPITVSTEGNNPDVVGVAEDFAGNTVTCIVTGLNIDKTAPVISSITPAADAYIEGVPLTLNYNVTDATSGIASEVMKLDNAIVSNGSVIDTANMTGSHTLEVTATDKAGNTSTKSVSFEIRKISATITFNPKTLNLKSKATENSVTVYAGLEAGYDVSAINLSTTKMFVNGAVINAQLNPTSVEDGLRMIKFNRSQVINALAGKTGDIIITVVGQLTDGKYFEGKDVVRVIK